MLKRSIDILFSAAGLTILLPVIGVVGFGIKLSSRGPVFYKQNRVGKNGKIFSIIKFRTMIVGAEKRGGISVGNDPRSTQLGRFLRASKMDELPQLWNVLIGEMSLIGPRPEIPEIVLHYSEEQKKVLSVHPGIVGPAQIIGRNEEEMLPADVEDAQDYYLRYILPDKLKIDLRYVENCTLLTDIRLLARGIKETIIGTFKPNALSGKNVWPSLFVVDLMMAAFSYFLSYCLRFDWSVPETEIETLLFSLPIVLLFRGWVFLYFKLYRTLFKYISIKDLIRIIQAVVLSSGLIIIAIFFLGLRVHSRSIFIIDSLLLLMAMGGIRVMLRNMSERRIAHSYSPPVNILIVGAGDVGEMAVRDLLKNGQNYHVIGFIDDDIKKQGISIHGFKVLGRRIDIPDVVHTLHVDEILIAINKISSQEMHAIINFCEKARVKYRMIPAVADIISGKIHLSKIRNVDISDLLGRDPIRLDLSAINSFIAGKRILVTGAGGSIGAELCRQISEYQPDQIILIDRSENYLFELHCDLTKFINESKIQYRFILADILDRAKIEKIVHNYKPHIVFHAAAQKHVPFGENNADEAVKSNVLGTRNMAEASHKNKVDHFVLISTDKAVNPTSVMGVTKRISELLLKTLSRQSETHFITVRFGNVLNSHGSVVPLFLKQIRNGGPVTLTDSRVQRYFMSIPEAVSLILQAVIMGGSGDIYILEMGKLIRIEELAKAMIKQAGMQPGVDVKIIYTGLRPGEKIYEELVCRNEIALATAHNMVRRIMQKSPIDTERLKSQISRLITYSHNGTRDDIIRMLKEIVPEYTLTETISKESRKEKEIIVEPSTLQPAFT